MCSIFLVDHAWTFQADCAQKQLEVINGLAVRMGALMGLSDEGEGQGAGSYDADSESGRLRGITSTGRVLFKRLLLQWNL